MLSSSCKPLYRLFFSAFFFFKQKTAYDIRLSLVGSEMCIRDSYSTYFMKIDGVKFKRKVVPGDTLQFEIHLLEPIRRGVAVVEAKAFVGETLACEAVLMAQVVKNKK